MREHGRRLPAIVTPKPQPRARLYYFFIPDFINRLNALAIGIINAPAMPQKIIHSKISIAISLASYRYWPIAICANDCPNDYANDDAPELRFGYVFHKLTGRSNLGLMVRIMRSGKQHRNGGFGEPGEKTGRRLYPRCPMSNPSATTLSSPANQPPSDFGPRTSGLRAYAPRQAQFRAALAPQPPPDSLPRYERKRNLALWPNCSAAAHWGWTLPPAFSNSERVCPREPLAVSLSQTNPSPLRSAPIQVNPT